MNIIYLAIIFIIILAVIQFKKPLWAAIFFGTVLTILLFKITPWMSLDLLYKSVASAATLKLASVIYQISFLQLILNKRGKMELAEKSLSGLFNNRRINVISSSMFMGLMPAPNSVLIVAPIIEAACDEHYDVKEKTFITTYLRHIPESIIPTYPQVLLAVQFSGVALSAFFLGMLPLIIMFIGIVYFIYIRRIPKETGYPKSKNRKNDFYNLLSSIWPLLFIISIVIIFNVEMYQITFITILIFLVLNKFTFEEIGPLFKEAFNRDVIMSIFAVMIFKDFITHTGVINELANTFISLPIPEFLIFALIYFLGSVVSGSQAMVALVFPLAFASMPNSGMPLLVLLMAFGHSAMQISPTHVCLFVVTKYFNTELKDLILKTLPIIAINSVVAIMYYLVLNLVF